MKDFKWQYSDEKVLFKTKENLVNFILSKIWLIFAFILITSLISLILYYFEYKIASIILFLIILISIILYNLFIYKNTFFLFTTRRIIKQIRTSLFSSHRKELKIMDIKSSLAHKKWFFQALLWVWNIKIEWTEKEWSIYFTWIKEHKEIANYIWRVIDYIKLNWHSDNISRYQNKKTRKQS